MKGTIRIETELCKGCTYCVLACPKGLVRMDDGLNKNGYCAARIDDTEECTGCALCAEVCPEIAIEVWREKARDGN